MSVDGIVDLLWGDRAPPGVTATLQAYVAGLRRVLEPERQRRAPATVLVTVGPGYALRVPDEAVDARRFEQAVSVERRRLQPLSVAGPSPLPRADSETRWPRLDVALGLWRGSPTPSSATHRRPSPSGPGSTSCG